MSVTAKALINSQYALNSANLEYEAPSSTRTIIDKFTAYNNDASAQTISIYVVPDGESRGDQHLIVKDKSISAKATSDVTELKNHVLETGDSVDVVVSLSNAVVIRMSGRECT